MCKYGPQELYWNLISCETTHCYHVVFSEWTWQYVNFCLYISVKMINSVSNISYPFLSICSYIYLFDYLFRYYKFSALPLWINAQTPNLPSVLLSNNMNHFPKHEFSYYNDIKNLKDLYQLRHNANLHDLDLRLNPVTKNEVDYRLFLIHLLPNLRKLGKDWHGTVRMYSTHKNGSYRNSKMLKSIIYIKLIF